MTHAIALRAQLGHKDPLDHKVLLDQLDSPDRRVVRVQPDPLGHKDLRECRAPLDRKDPLELPERRVRPDPLECLGNKGLPDPLVRSELLEQPDPLGHKDLRECRAPLDRKDPLELPERREQLAPLARKDLPDLRVMLGLQAPSFPKSGRSYSENSRLGNRRPEFVPTSKRYGRHPKTALRKSALRTARRRELSITLRSAPVASRTVSLSGLPT